MIMDRAKPWRWADEEIVAELAGEAGEAAEIRAAIRLLESEDTGATIVKSVKQGTFGRTTSTTGGRWSGLIASLNDRLARIGGADGAAGSVMATAEAEFPRPGHELDMPGGWPWMR